MLKRKKLIEKWKVIFVNKFDIVYTARDPTTAGEISEQKCIQTIHVSHPIFNTIYDQGMWLIRSVVKTVIFS